MKPKLELNCILVAFSFLLNIVSIDGARTQYVTCGSIVKLLNSDYRSRLHSHDVKYGSGSGQQSVTGIDIQEDVGSHWSIKAATGKFCNRGEPIKCGDTIRLEHLTTKRNLHSHMFSSPLSGEQEVSCYGVDGLGDTGDHWEVICSSDAWVRDSPVRFRHVDTAVFLGLSGRSFGRPISGQMEVVGFNNPQHGTRWTTAEGLYIVPQEKESHYEHTEL